MTFLTVEALWALAILPLLIAAYVALMRRRRAAVRYTSIERVREALAPGHRFRQHLPALLLLCALSLSVLATARPVITAVTPSHERTIILAVDVSTSMGATDVFPTRLAAAQAAARTFIRTQPPGVRIGIIAFAGHADLIRSPTSDHGDALQALDGLSLQHSTSISAGLTASLLTLFPHETFGGNLDLFGTGRSPLLTDPLRGDLRAQFRRQSEEHRPPGTHPSAAIVLLTDGRDTMGHGALKAAKLAAERGIRVHTVGFGRPPPDTPGGDHGSRDMMLDEDTLRAIAELTLGKYFHAATARELSNVYRTLAGRIELRSMRSEVTALAAAAAALLLAVAGLLSTSRASTVNAPGWIPRWHRAPRAAGPAR